MFFLFFFFLFFILLLTILTKFIIYISVGLGLLYWKSAIGIKAYFHKGIEMPMFPFFDFISLKLKDCIGIIIYGLCVTWLYWTIHTQKIDQKIMRILSAFPLNPLNLKEKQIIDMIEEVKVATKRLTRIKGIIIPSKIMNSFAFSNLEGQHFIGVTQGLLDHLSRAQLETVIAHEAAHIFTGDSLPKTIAAFTFEMFSSLSHFMQDVTDTVPSKNLVTKVLSIPRMLNYLMAMFISREREYRADAMAVELTRDPLSLAESLYLLHQSRSQLGPITQSLETIFLINPRQNNLDEKKGFRADLFSTHPPIRERIKILLDMAHEDLRTMEERLLKK